MTRMVSWAFKTFGNSVTTVVGMDARGFLFGPTIAMRLGCAFVPIRKKGKLPGTCTSVKYVKEYGEDIFDIQNDAIQKGNKVIIVDDLIATGGTVEAAKKLIEGLEAEVVGVTAVIELMFLKGREKFKGVEVYSLLEF